MKRNHVPLMVDLPPLLIFNKNLIVMQRCLRTSIVGSFMMFLFINWNYEAVQLRVRRLSHLEHELYSLALLHFSKSRNVTIHVEHVTCTIWSFVTLVSKLCGPPRTHYHFLIISSHWLTFRMPCQSLILIKFF